MTSFCDCETCKKIKKMIKYPKCDYCKEHHDTKLVCPAYKKVLDSTGKNQLCTNKEVSDSIETALVLKHCSEYYLEICNGKYTVYQEKSGALKALRYGEPWQDLCGNNLVFYLMVELIEAQEKINKSLEQYDNYCAIDGDNVACAVREILKGE